MVPENFIALIAQGQGAAARAVLEDGLSNIVLGRLEERKRELAAGLFSGHANAPVQEEFEQLDEISKATALSVSDKRNTKGQALFNASTRSSDPLTKKVLGNRSLTMFAKADKAANYAHKKSK